MTISDVHYGGGAGFATPSGDGTVTVGLSSGVSAGAVGDLLLVTVYAQFGGVGVSIITPGFVLVHSVNSSWKQWAKVITVPGIQTTTVNCGRSDGRGTSCGRILRKNTNSQWSVTAHSGVDTTGAGNGTWTVSAGSSDALLGDVFCALSVSQNSGTNNVNFTGLTLSLFTVGGAVLGVFDASGGPHRDLNNGGFCSSTEICRIVTSAASSPGVIDFSYTYTFNTLSTGSTVITRVHEVEAPLVTQVPVIALVSPPEGPIAAVDPIVIDVYAPSGDLSFFQPRLILQTLGIVESMHDWGGGLIAPSFEPAYIAASTRTPITNGFRYSFERSSGWPDSAISLVGNALTFAGLQTIESFEFTVPVAPGIPGACGEEGTNERPVVTFTSPPLGQATHRFTPIVFQVTCGTALRRVLVRVAYQGRVGWDFVYDGVLFGPNFQGGVNGVTVLSSPLGREFTILRSGGWPAPPLVVVYPITIRGMEEV